MRACPRHGRLRLQRQRWHGCCCLYGVGSGGGRVHVGSVTSVRGACAPAAAVVPNHGTFAARTADDGAGAGHVPAWALTTNGALKSHIELPLGVPFVWRYAERPFRTNHKPVGETPQRERLVEPEEPPPDNVT
jgi:hypothetical protein